MPIIMDVKFRLWLKSGIEFRSNLRGGALEKYRLLHQIHKFNTQKHLRRIEIKPTQDFTKSPDILYLELELDFKDSGFSNSLIVMTLI